MVPEKNRLHLYQKKGRIGEDDRAEDELEEREDVDNAIKEFAEIFKEVTGNEFEPWERERRNSRNNPICFILLTWYEEN